MSTNSHRFLLSFVVLEERLELSRVAPHDFESCAYTDSATPAMKRSVADIKKLINRAIFDMVKYRAMAYESNSIFWVDVNKVVPNPYQPRREFDERNLKDLSESIRMYGVLQPLTVTRKEVVLPDGAFRTEYELIAGERRLRASKLAGLAQVPVIIRQGEESELMKLELAIIENLQREDLNPVDRAMAFKQLADTFGLSHAEVGRKVGRSREFVSNSIRLLNLPDTIISAVSQGEITDGHGRTLLMLNDRPEEQDVVFREILLKKLSVREVERMARRIATDKVRKKSPLDMDPELIEIEKQFTESLGTRVQISKTDYGGKIVIDYFSAEDLQKLLEVVHAKQLESEQGSVAALTAATPLETVPEEAVDDRSESEIENAEEAEVKDTVGGETPVLEPQGAADAQGKAGEKEDDIYSLKNFSL